jgi:hypothetical protein
MLVVLLPTFKAGSAVHVAIITTIPIRTGGTNVYKGLALGAGQIFMTQAFGVLIVCHIVVSPSVVVVLLV